MSAFRNALGALRLAGRRAAAAGQPGLTVWTAAGERELAAMGATVRDGAHRAEIGSLEIEEQLRGIVADGKITRRELAELARLTGAVHRVAEECHDLGETVK